MVNTLVFNAKNKGLGIGCIAKELKDSCKVNFGTDDVMTVKKVNLEIIDTSKCKTVSLKNFQRRILSDKSTLDYVILGNELKHFVGIGWITSRVVTLDDLKTYPRVIQ